MPDLPSSNRATSRICIALFCAALAAHFYFVTINWTYEFMAGHEFRQTQTALISYFIDKENDFSINYPVPLVGKPWVLPLEFPLYEWTTVLVKRVTGLPLYEAARCVTLACFYLTLPAIFILLGRFGIPRARRLLTLALLLVCPVYVFYSRAILIESMVLMFSVWFLTLFVITMEERRLRWLVLCVVFGTAAALVKSLTFFVWVVPAACFGAWSLWRDWHSRAGWLAVARTTAWGIGAVVIPFAAAIWWVRYTDAIKATHSSAHIFTSQSLFTGNYGSLNLGTRLSPQIWGSLTDRWQEAIMPSWVVVLIVVAGFFFARRQRWLIAAGMLIFLIAQSLFPLAYAYHDYYFYACAAILMITMGVVLHGVLDSKLPRWLAWAFVAVPIVFMAWTYRGGYFRHQSIVSFGGTGLTATLRDFTPDGSVIVVAGADWSAIIPYYTKRRALMIRNGLEANAEYLNRAFGDLADEDVSAFVLISNQRENHELLELARTYFDIEGTPTYSHTTADVYLSSSVRPGARISLSGHHIDYEGISITEKTGDTEANDNRPTPISKRTASSALQMVSPAPTRFLFQFGFSSFAIDGENVLSVHPDSDLWVPPPPDAKTVSWDFGIVSAAYEREGDRTDGVEFVLFGETTGGERRELYRRLLTPVVVAADRGMQSVTFPIALEAGETLVFATRPHTNAAFDWAYWRKIEVK